MMQGTTIHTSFQDRIQRVITRSLTCPQPFFVVSTFSCDTLDAIHDDMLASTWETLKRQQHLPLVRDLSVTRFPLPWSEHPALAFVQHCLEHRRLDAWGACIRHAEATRPLECENVLMREVLDRLAHAQTPTQQLLLWALLTDRCSPEELRSLSLPRNLTLQDRFVLLQHLWSCQQGLDEKAHMQQHSRLWLCVEGLDALLGYPPEEVCLLTRGLFHLITCTGTYLTLWLNIPTEDPAIITGVTTRLGPPLWDLVDEELLLLDLDDDKNHG